MSELALEPSEVPETVTLFGTSLLEVRKVGSEGAVICEWVTAAPALGA